MSRRKFTYTMKNIEEHPQYHSLVKDVQRKIMKVKNLATYYGVSSSTISELRKELGVARDNGESHSALIKRLQSQIETKNRIIQRMQAQLNSVRSGYYYTPPQNNYNVVIDQAVADLSTLYLDKKPSTKEELKKQYYKLCQVFHPDKGMDTTEEFKRMKAAYERLLKTY